MRCLASSLASLVYPCFTLDGLDPAVQVKVVRELIHEVTGIRINTFFLPWDQDVDGNGSPGNGQGSSTGGPGAALRRLGLCLRCRLCCPAWPASCCACCCCCCQLHCLPCYKLSQLQATLYCLTGFMLCNNYVACHKSSSLCCGTWPQGQTGTANIEITGVKFSLQWPAEVDRFPGRCHGSRSNDLQPAVAS